MKLGIRTSLVGSSALMCFVCRSGVKRELGDSQQIQSMDYTSKQTPSRNTAQDLIKYPSHPVAQQKGIQSDLSIARVG